MPPATTPGDKSLGLGDAKYGTTEPYNHPQLWGESPASALKQGYTSPPRHPHTLALVLSRAKTTPHPQESPKAPGLHPGQAPTACV